LSRSLAEGISPPNVGRICWTASRCEGRAKPGLKSDTFAA
jgi:hypothetical protein